MDPSKAAACLHQLYLRCDILNSSDDHVALRTLGTVHQVWDLRDVLVERMRDLGMASVKDEKDEVGVSRKRIQCKYKDMERRALSRECGLIRIVVGAAGPKVNALEGGQTARGSLSDGGLSSGEEFVRARPEYSPVLWDWGEIGRD